jgi:2'-hydroxyisoflavone reductase
MPFDVWSRMHILVLGGTRFLGRAIVPAALGRGHRVTMLNRGVSAPGLFPGVPRLIADRAGDLSVLSGHHFDAVVDVAGYHPDVVARSVAALPGVRYAFVSTLSVYADHSGRQREDEPVLPPGDSYGARKAAAERVVLDAYPDGALVARAGLLVGPHDPTDRFGYWPRRVARGGRMLAPGRPDDPVQFIDVRDLAGWLVDGLSAGLAGVFNATGETLTMGELLDACGRAVPAGAAEPVWVSGERLLAAGVDPWMGVPLWIGEPGWEGANLVDIARARAAGLDFRPLVDTIRDTLAWDVARGGPDMEGLTPDREQSLLSTLAPADPSGHPG